MREEYAKSGASSENLLLFLPELIGAAFDNHLRVAPGRRCLEAALDELGIEIRGVGVGTLLLPRHLGELGDALLQIAQPLDKHFRFSQDRYIRGSDREPVSCRNRCDGHRGRSRDGAILIAGHALIMRQGREVLIDMGGCQS